MTADATFDVPPPRVKGGPRERPQKPPTEVFIRKPDASVVLITKHVRQLWNLLDLAVRYHELDDEDLEAAIALGILAKFPVAHLMAEQRQRDADRSVGAAQRREAALRQAWLAEQVEVVAAHPFREENDSVHGPRARPGTKQSVTRAYAQRLDRAGMIERPCQHLYEGDPAFATARQ